MLGCLGLNCLFVECEGDPCAAPSQGRQAKQRSLPADPSWRERPKEAAGLASVYLFHKNKEASEVVLKGLGFLSDPEVYADALQLKKSDLRQLDRAYEAYRAGAGPRAIKQVCRHEVEKPQALNNNPRLYRFLQRHGNVVSHIERDLVRLQLDKRAKAIPLQSYFNQDDSDFVKKA